MFDLWSDDATKIAQLELAVVFMALAYMAPYLRGHHGIWWVDSIAALMALARGRSNVDELVSRIRSSLPCSSPAALNGCLLVTTGLLASVAIVSRILGIGETTLLA